VTNVLQVASVHEDSRLVLDASREPLRQLVKVVLGVRRGGSLRIGEAVRRRKAEDVRAVNSPLRIASAAASQKQGPSAAQRRLFSAALREQPFMAAKNSCDGRAASISRAQPRPRPWPCLRRAQPRAAAHSREQAANGRGSSARGYNLPRHG